MEYRNTISSYNQRPTSSKSTMFDPSIKKINYAFSPMPDMSRTTLILPEYPDEPLHVTDRDYVGFSDYDINNRQYNSMLVVPEWCKDNQYIKKGYRECYKSASYYIRSIFQWHNETLNIWTHLLSTIGYAVFFIYSLADPTIRHTIDSGEIQAVVYYMLLSSSVTCFFWSFMMHTFFPMSKPVCHWLQRADYMGIFFNITCVYEAFIFFAFYTEVQLQFQYTCIILFFSAVFLLCFVCMHGCVKPEQFKWRAIGLGLYGVSIIVPIVHRISVSFQNDIYFLLELRYFLGACFLFIVGIAFYITKFPERMFPDGRFDRIANSHTLFHLFTLAGNILCTYGIWNTLYNETNDARLSG